MRLLPRLVTLTLVALAPAARAAPPWAGVYVGSDGKSTTAIVPVGDSIWWMDRGIQVVTLAKKGVGFAVSPTGATLVGGRGGWRLREGGELRAQVVDPFYDRLRAGLAGEHTFLHLGRDARPDGGTLVVHDGLVAGLELGKRGCVSVLLRPDPGVNHERKVGRVAPQPAAHAIASRAFVLLEIESDECPIAVVPSEPPRTNGMAGGAFVFARSDGTPIAVELVGYMMVELYLSRDATPTESREVMQSAAEEAGRAAE
jgi:hypothetical protein